MSKAEAPPYTTSNKKIEYRKNGVFFPNFLRLMFAPLAFFMLFHAKLSSLAFYVWLLVGIIGTIYLIYTIRDYIHNKLVIGEYYLEIDNKKIPVELITEVERKKYKIKVKTTNQDIVIDMKDYLAFSNEEAVNEVHKRLAGFVPEASDKNRE